MDDTEAGLRKPEFWAPRLAVRIHRFGARTFDELAADPEMGSPHWHLGLALLEWGDREAAVEHWREFVRLEPDSIASGPCTAAWPSPPCRTLCTTLEGRARAMASTWIYSTINDLSRETKPKRIW